MAVACLGLLVLAGCSGSSGGTASPTGLAAPTSSAATSTSDPASVAPSATSTDGSTAAATSSAPVGAASGADAVLQISVRGKTVTPKPSRHDLHVGDRVHLVVTTDKANVVHVHGVDIERNVAAGVPLTLDFTVEQTGVYPIELHEPELLIAQLVVR